VVEVLTQRFRDVGGSRQPQQADRRITQPRHHSGAAFVRSSLPQRGLPSKGVGRSYSGGTGMRWPIQVARAVSQVDKSSRENR
jgi:hypothetical protein